MTLKTSQDIGLAIRQARRQRSWSQAALAAQAGVGRQWLVEVEHGKPGAELGLILKTLNALGLALKLDEGSQPSAADDEALVPIDLDDLIERARQDKP